MSNTLFRKVIASIAATSIVLSIVSPVLGVKAADSQVEAANRLASLGIIVDQSTNPSAYRLNDSITRGEMAKVMLELAGVEPNTTCEGKFADVSATKPNTWVCGYVEKGLELGMLSPNPTFRPNDRVTEAEALKMVLEARGIAPVAGVEPWSEAYRQAAVNAGVMAEDDKLNANGVAKRSFVFVNADSAVTVTTDTTEGGDVSVDVDEGGDVLVDGDQGDSEDLGSLLDGLLGGDDEGGMDENQGTEGNDNTGNDNTGTDETTNNETSNVTGNNLEVSLSPSSPANGTSIPMAGIVNFAKVDLTAGSSDVSVNTIEVRKNSLSSVSTSTKIWFEKDGKRVSSRTSFTSEGNAVVSFAPAYVIKAGSTETLDMLVELSDTAAGSDYSFKLENISSSADNVQGSVITNTLRTSNYTVATFKLENTSSTASYNANGDETYELGAFKITATKTGSVTETRDLIFKTITLYQSGSADLSNLKDIELVRDGAKVSTEVSVDGKTMTIQTMDTVKDGSTAIYYIRAKVAYVEKTQDTYQFYTKNASDIVIDEISSGIRSKAESTSYEKLTSNLYTVKGSDLSFYREDVVSLSSTVTPGTSNVVLMQGYIDSKSSVNLEDPKLTYIVSNASGTLNLSDYFSTAYLLIGNSSLSASASSTVFGSTTATGALTFNGTVTVNGKTPVKVYVNLKSNSNLASLNIKLDDLKLSSFTGRNEYISNQEQVSSSIGSIPGINVNVAMSTLSVTRNDGLGDTTIASGLKGVTLFGGKLTSTQGNPVRVTSLTFGFAGNTSTSTGFVNNSYATLYVDGVAVKSKTIDAISVKFDGFNFDVSTSKDANVVLKADFTDAFNTGTITATLSSLEATDTVSSTSLNKTPNLAGATFAIADADATFAVSTDTPKTQLITAGQNSNKLFSFRLTAKNDNLNIKEVVLTGSNLDIFTNFTLKDSSGNSVSASSASGTEVIFANISPDLFKVSQDSSYDLHVYADAKTNTNMSGAVLYLDKSIIRGSNGKEITLTVNNVSSNESDVYENTVKIAQVDPVSKNLSSDALRFNLTAAGKNSVTLSGITLTGTISGYTGSYTVEVRKVNDDTLVASGSSLTTLSFVSNTVVDSGKTEVYYIKLTGITIDSSAQQSDWTLKLTDIEVVPTTGHSYNLSRYPNNSTTLPIVSSKN